MEMPKVFLGGDFYLCIYDPRKNKKEFANIIINIGIDQIYDDKFIVRLQFCDCDKSLRQMLKSNIMKYHL